MDKCLSKIDISRLMAGSADKEFMLASLQHMEICPACREAALKTEEFKGAAESLRKRIAVMAACLDYEQLTAYLDNTLSESDKSLVDRHLSLCHDCQEDLDYLKQIEGLAAMGPHRTFSPARPARSKIFNSRVFFSFGLTACTVAAICLVLLRPPVSTTDGQIAVISGQPKETVSTPPRQTPIPSEQPDRKKPDIPNLVVKPVRHTEQVAVLHDGLYLIHTTKDALREIKQQDSGKRVSIASDIAAVVQAKLSTGKARKDLPVLMAKADTDILRGSGETTGLEPSIQRPHGTSVLQTTPILSWNAPERIESFTVEVFNPEGEKIWETATDSRKCQVDISLESGSTYLWRVGSRVGDETFYSKAVPFRVLQENEAQSLERYLESSPNSHMIKGSILESYGLYDEALIEFQVLAKENPDSQIARRMVDTLKKEIQEVRK